MCRSSSRDMLMTGRQRERRLFQFSLRELVFELVAVGFSAGLLRYAVMQDSFLVGVAGVMLLGGALGACNRSESRRRAGRRRTDGRIPRGVWHCQYSCRYCCVSLSSSTFTSAG